MSSISIAKEWIACKEVFEAEHLQNIFLTFIWLSRLIVHLVTFLFKECLWTLFSLKWWKCLIFFVPRCLFAAMARREGRKGNQTDAKGSEWLIFSQTQMHNSEEHETWWRCGAKRKTKEHRQASKKKTKKKPHAMCTGRQKEVQRHQTDAADHICWEILRGAQRKTGWHRAIINGRLARRHGWSASAVVQLFRRYFVWSFSLHHKKH